MCFLFLVGFFFFKFFFNIPSCLLRNICFEQNITSDYLRSIFKGIETLKCFWGNDVSQLETEWVQLGKDLSALQEREQWVSGGH